MIFINFIKFEIISPVQSEKVWLKRLACGIVVALWLIQEEQDFLDVFPIM